MTEVHQAVGGYLAMRRVLGFSLEREGRWLMDFADHLEHAGSAHITTELAVAWATRTRTDVNPAWWNHRLAWSACSPGTCTPWTRRPRSRQAN